jgi:hypothetical protein
VEEGRGGGERRSGEITTKQKKRIINNLLNCIKSCVCTSDYCYFVDVLSTKRPVKRRMLRKSQRLLLLAPVLLAAAAVASCCCCKLLLITASAAGCFCG